MLNSESSIEIVKKLFYEKGYSGLVEIFDFPNQLCAPILLALVRLSLDEQPSEESIEPIIRDYSRTVMDMVRNMSAQQIREAVIILIENVFTSHRRLLRISSIDGYLDFIASLDHSAYEQSKEVVGNYIEGQVNEKTYELGMLIQYWLSHQEEMDNLGLAEFYTYQIEPVQTEVDALLDW